jgi:hypothetical protein
MPWVYCKSTDRIRLPFRSGKLSYLLFAPENQTLGSLPGAGFSGGFSAFRRRAVYRTWIDISANHFDYTFDPVNTDGTAPSRRFMGTGHYSYVTVNGVVVHGSKINNLLWAVFGRGWGYNEFDIRTGAHLNQLARAGHHWDSASSRNAISRGCEIFKDPAASITGVLTPSALRSMQDEALFIEERLWPCADPADMSPGKSLLIRPRLDTHP